MQIVQTQFRRCKKQHLIRVFTVCLQEILCQIQYRWKLLPKTFKTINWLKRMDKSTGQKRVKVCINLRKLPYSFSNQAGAHAYSCLVPPRPLFEDNISILEVKKAVDSAKRGKVCGFHNIPSEVLHNDSTIYFLHVLFNVCFNKGIVPSVWGNVSLTLFQSRPPWIQEIHYHIEALH